MSNLSRAIPYADDMNSVFEALSQFCKEQKIDAESVEGARLAGRLFDLLQSGVLTKESLVEAARCKPAGIP